MAAHWCRQTLYGVAEHRAGHHGGMAVEKFAQQLFADTFAHFAQHPARGFAHEIMWMTKEVCGYAYGRLGYAVA